MLCRRKESLNDGALQQFWKTYKNTWVDISQNERSKLLEAGLAHDVAYTNPDDKEASVDLQAKPSCP